MHRPSPLLGWRPGRALVLLLALGALTAGGGCSLVQSRVQARAGAVAAGSLGAALLDQDDPELVRESLPAWIIMLDGLARSPDATAETVGAAARLYATYAVVFVQDPQRAGLLAQRAREHGERALCIASRDHCDRAGLSHEEYVSRLDSLRPGAAGALFSYALGRLAYLRTHSDDWQALSGLPGIEAALQRLLVIGEQADAARVNDYLGILNTLRPPALGGEPERGRAYFETALQLSGRRDLGILVDFARSYARLVYDRELHDRLLREVLAAEPRQPGLTTFNQLARREAQALLESADEYF